MAAADLVEYVAKSLVDDPEAVKVEVVNGEDGTLDETLLRPVREELDPQLAAQAAQPADEADREPRGTCGRVARHG